MPNNYKSLLLNLSKNIVNNIKFFKVIHPNTLIPFGLKPHTRSISWLAETVVSQNIKLNIKKYGIKDFEEPKSDIGVWDFKITFQEMSETLFVNFKVTNITTKKQQNDMSSIKKYVFYKKVS